MSELQDKIGWLPVYTAVGAFWGAILAGNSDMPFGLGLLTVLVFACSAAVWLWVQA